QISERPRLARTCGRVHAQPVVAWVEVVLPAQLRDGEMGRDARGELREVRGVEWLLDANGLRAHVHTASSAQQAATRAEVDRCQIVLRTAERRGRPASAPPEGRTTQAPASADGRQLLGL